MKLRRFLRKFDPQLRTRFLVWPPYSAAGWNLGASLAVGNVIRGKA